MMKKITLTVLTCLLLTSAFAQFGRHKSDELSYEIVGNNPSGAENLSLYLAPVYVEFYKPNSDYNFGYGAGFYYRLPGDKLFVEGHFRSAYLDRLDEDENSSVQSGRPQNGSDAMLTWGGALTYNFINQEVEKKYDVTIRSNSRVRYYTMIPAKAKKCIGVRLGFDSYRGEYKFDKGITGKIADSDTSASKDVTTTGQSFYTMMRTYTVHLGISRTFVYDLKTLLNFQGEKNMKRNVHYTSRLYFDLSMAPVISFDNVYVPMSWDGSGGGYGWYNYHLVDISGMKKQPLGFRAGWTTTSNKKFGTEIGVEFGSRPGLAGSSFGDNLYLTLRFAACLSTKLGK